MITGDKISKVVKYRAVAVPGPLPPISIVKEINISRNRLRVFGLIGQKNGEGYGNISTKVEDSRDIIITCSQTGGLETLSQKHCARVINYDLAGYYVVHTNFENSFMPSSEFFSHQAVYEARRETAAVIHVHHEELWHKLINIFPTTSPHATYGSQELAHDIMKVASKNKNYNLIVLGGHQSGILSFAKSLEEATEEIIRHLRQ
ncbi:MAG: class II aldolase/adducin family protein [Candidatus Woesearchaeota archaeon]